MRTLALILIGLSAVYCLSPMLYAYKSVANEKLAKLMKSKQPNFADLHNELSIVMQLKGTYDSDQVCVFLRKQEATHLSLEQAYYYLRTLSLADCDNKNIELPKTNENSDNAMDFYYSTLINLEEGKEAKCRGVQAFLAQSGAAKSNRKNSEDNFVTASYLYHLASACVAQNQTEVLSVVHDPIQAAVLNLQEVFDEARAFAEFRGSLHSTARFVAVFLDLLPQLQLNEKVQKELNEFVIQQTVVNLLQANLENINLTSEERYWILRALTNKQLSDIVVPTVEKETLFPGKIVQVPVKFTNLLGDKVQAPPNVTADINRREKAIERGLKLANGVFESSSELFRSLGQFTITVKTNGKYFQPQFTDRFHVGTKLKVKDLNFALVEGKGAQVNFDHFVAEGETYHNVFKASEKSYLHVIFKLTYEKGISITPAYVGIRLSHPEYESASFFVTAQYDSKREVYYCIYDLGDPDHILPHNGLYKAELLIGDVNLAENKRWTFANIDVSFGIPSKGAPLQDTDNIQPPYIYHHFEPPRQDVPTLFVFSFVAVIVLTFLFYMLVLAKTDANFDKLPSDPTKQLLVYVFFGLVLAVFGVIWLFWVALNLIETVVILGALMIPLFLVGNFALLSMK